MTLDLFLLLLDYLTYGTPHNTVTMATSPKDKILIAVDDSQYAEEAFYCESNIFSIIYPGLRFMPF